MTKQQTNTVPPLSHLGHVDVQLRIFTTAEGFGGHIGAEGQMWPIRIAISTHDLRALNNSIQKTLEEVMLNTSRKESLYELAKAGNAAFKEIFKDKTTRSFVNDLLRDTQNRHIQITSEDFFFPWDLIYPEDLNAPLSYNRFWGMKYIIQRTIIYDDYEWPFVSPWIQAPSRPKLGLLKHDGLSHVNRKEVPYFEDLQKQGRVALAVLRDLDPDKFQNEMLVFSKFWKLPLDIAHFACHAVCRDNLHRRSSILLSRDFSISLEDMEAHNICIESRPLVIMNACETGRLNPLYTGYFAGAFIRYGARGVVATECGVPDAFAADFALEFYEKLLSGRSLGESLLNTRRVFLERNSDPSGLLYSMYANPKIQLLQDGDLEQTLPQQ